VTVVDASAVLTYLQGEPGAEEVERHLEEGAVCGAVNWSEVAQKIRAAGRDWDLARALLVSYSVEVAPVTEDDAEWAAARWRAGEGLSIADRLCMALGRRLDSLVVTADASWGAEDGIEQIR
jgi:ribonuclease VapC